MAQRLIDQTEGDLGKEKGTPEETATITKPKVDSSTSETHLVERAIIDETIQPLPAFAKVEKSLSSLGFFTPSSRRIKKKEVKVKRMTFTRIVGDKKVVGTAEIHPLAGFGLPITADQDKFLALQHIITNILREQGRVENPIRFTSAELIRLLNNRLHSGKNYKDIREWLKVMTATTIVSTGVIYEAEQKQYADDTFHVFERAVSVGKKMPDGSRAAANYVWLSSWQLENINNNWLIPIDLPTYRQLKKHIAKALVPLLQIWLFATQKIGSFEKRYDELCEVLSLKVHTNEGHITRQLKGSLDELVRFEYLEKWKIKRTANERVRDYKVVFFHGPKFYRDRQQRIAEKVKVESPVVVSEYQKPGDESPSQPARVSPIVAPRAKAEPAPKSDAPPATPEQAKLLEELSARGLLPAAALKLLQSIPEDRLEAVGDYIDYWDATKKTTEVREGFLYSLIKEGSPLPASFETRIQREERQRKGQRSKDRQRLKSALEQAYADHRKRVINRFIADELGQGEFDRRVEIRKKELARQGSLFEKLAPEQLARFATTDVREEIAPVVSYEEFRKRELPNVLARLELNAADLGLTVASEN